MVRHNEQNMVDWESGCEIIQKVIEKLKRGIEERSPDPIDAMDYMTAYGTIYNLCAQKSPHQYSEQLYDKHRESLEEYITSTVLPSLSGKRHELFLRELVERWANYKKFAKWLSYFYAYVNRFYVERKHLPRTEKVARKCFRDLVCRQFTTEMRDALRFLTYQERSGNQNYQALLKNICDITTEIGCEIDFGVSNGHA